MHSRASKIVHTVFVLPPSAVPPISSPLVFFPSPSPHSLSLPLIVSRARAYTLRAAGRASKTRRIPSRKGRSPIIAHPLPPSLSMTGHIRVFARESRSAGPTIPRSGRPLVVATASLLLFGVLLSIGPLSCTSLYVSSLVYGYMYAHTCVCTREDLKRRALRERAARRDLINVWTSCKAESAQQQHSERLSRELFFFFISSLSRSLPPRFCVRYKFSEDDAFRD